MARMDSAQPGPIHDPAIRAVIQRLAAANARPPDGGPRNNADLGSDPHNYAAYGFPIWPDQGALIYLLCRVIKATRVVEFATSTGFSTLHFAAALRDNGGGIVIGSEIVPQKVEAARRHLAAAGLDRFADIREGDARETLRDLGGPVDFALIDGWPVPGDGPSLARQVTEIITPQLRIGAFLMNDNAEPDFIDFIRDPANGFLSMTLPLKAGTELAVRVA
jgi:predicted O-methyltransferase YrrM